jgi:hypothetical protein
MTVSLKCAKCGLVDVAPSRELSGVRSIGGRDLCGPCADTRPRDAATERAVGRAFATGDEFVLDAPKNVPAVWGSGEDVLWAQGEALLIAAPQGVGKSTLAQQIAFARIGALPTELLGYPIEPDERPLVYVAADRPQQVRRSMTRMVGEDQRARLRALLRVWPGPLPFTLTDDPARLASWLLEQNAGTVVIDSLKDIAIGLAEDAIGAAVNQARQHVLAAGIDVIELHHQRKGQDGRKPRALEDVYGSTWITAGTGSVVLLWGEAGDPYVELTHLKQPVAEVGPLTLRHDHARGRTTLPEVIDILDLAANGVTATEAAQAIYDVSTPSRNQRERARRRLDKLADDGRLTRLDPDEKGGSVTYVLASGCEPRVTPRDPSVDPSRDHHAEGHAGSRFGSTAGHAHGHGGSRGHTAPPFKGGVTLERDPLLATEEEEALVARLESASARGEGPS